VLPAALLVATAASAAQTVVLDANRYVDTSSEDVAAEADNTRAAIRAHGHSTARLIKIDADTIAAALATAHALVIPELENGDLASALTPDARSVIRAFVESGGGLIVNGTSDNRAGNLLNTLFGWRVTTAVVGRSLRANGAIATEFAGGPQELPANTRTRGLENASLPPGARRIYVGELRSAVVLVPVGLGTVIYLGWDWFDGKPRGTQNGGWLDVMGRAVAEATMCFDTSQGDTDGDGVSDACDPVPVCADEDGLRAVQFAPRTVLSRVNAEPIHGNDGLAISTAFHLPAGSTFADLNPRELPMGILLQARDGSPRLTVTLGTGRYLGEGTAGWQLRRQRTKWVFTDTTGNPSGGIVHATITDLASESPRRVRVTVTGKNSDYPVVTGDEPLEATLLIGDGQSGECGILRFVPGQCNWSEEETRLTCAR
jgi:hypothetical protein